MMLQKRKLILMFAVLGLLIISFSIHITFSYIITSNKWIGLIIGTAFMLLGIIIYQFGRKHEFFYLVSFFLNMVGIGLSITAYYVFKAYSLTFRDYSVAVLVSIALLILFSLLSRIQIIKRHHKLFLAIFIFLSLIISLALWLSFDSFTGLSFYYLNVIYFFMIGIVSLPESFIDLSKEMAFISFGAFIVISIIVLIILSEGEVLSGVDGISFSGGKKKKK